MTMESKKPNATMPTAFRVILDSHKIIAFCVILELFAFIERPTNAVVDSFITVETGKLA